MSKIFLKYKLAGPGLAVLLLPFSPSIALAYELEIKLPGVPAAVSNPGAYISYLFVFGLSLAGFLAVGAIAWGGIQYMIAGTGTSMTSIGKAKEMIFGALSGIVLLLCSWLILNTIDPSLTNLSPLSVDQIRAKDVAEPPSPPDNGLTESATTPAIAGAQEIKCKTAKICQDIQSGQVDEALVKSISSLPVAVTVTETGGSHGCSASDSCVPGAACGTSTHCSGRAADIRVSNLNAAQKEQVMQALSQNKCVDQLFYSGFPQYCRAGGGQAASANKSCANHTDHIHYSVKAGCV